MANRTGNSNEKKGFWYHFTQQSLNAWTPRYTSATVSPLMIGIGIFLIPLGIVVLIITTDGVDDIKEKRIDYTNCTSVADPSMTCAEYISVPKTGNDDVCQCSVEFELPKPMKAKKIYMYYALDNFYQNVRQYVKSRDENQLLGKLGTAENPNPPAKDCDPYDYDDQGKIIFPCGAVANSMFNDSIQLYYNEDVEGEVKIDQIRRGIAWASDLKYRYKNPPEFSNKSHPIWQRFTTQPKGWTKTIWDLDPEDPENNGIQNEDFVVWMRVSAFSNLLKLYRIIETPKQDILGDRLPAGKYRLEIDYRFEVISFQGKKAVVLSAPTIFGHQNLVQGIAAVSLGGVSVILGLLFLLCGCSNRHGKGSFSGSTTTSIAEG